MSVSQLAAQTGLARETVSREIAKLKKQALIVRAHGQFTIPDLVALEQQLL